MAESKKDKREANARRHDFLLTLFPDNNKEYSVLWMNGFVLVRQWNGSTHRWEVAIWKESTFKKIHYKATWNGSSSPPVATESHVKKDRGK